MTCPESLKTDRLILRRWKDADLEPFAKINADPDVTEFLRAPLSTAESNEMARKLSLSFDERGYGLWAAELAETAEMIGFIGLATPRFESHFTPCVEIGWRLAKNHWGKGLAVEGAKAALADGFERLKLEEIVSFTSVLNAKSIRVMEKLGMKSDPKDNFDHPLVAPGEKLRPHVLYRIRRTEFP